MWSFSSVQIFPLLWGVSVMLWYRGPSASISSSWVYNQLGKLLHQTTPGLRDCTRGMEFPCGAVLSGTCSLSSDWLLGSFYWVTLSSWKSFLPICTVGKGRAFQGSGLEVMKILSPSSCWPALSHVAKIIETQYTAMETLWQVTRDS